MAEKEFIEREATQMEIKKLCDKHRLCYGEHYSGFAEDIANVTSTIPTADVQKIRHGKWEKSDFDVVCSRCGYIESAPRPFCSECGTKMDKGEY